MGYCICLYVDANVQLVQCQDTASLLVCLLYAFFFSFQTTPLSASVFCGIRREAYPPTGLDTPLSLAFSIFRVVLTDFQWLVSQLTPSQETPHQLSVQ